MTLPVGNCAGTSICSCSNGIWLSVRFWRRLFNFLLFFLGSSGF